MKKGFLRGLQKWSYQINEHYGDQGERDQVTERYTNESIDKGNNIQQALMEG
jgi:hypothetical protein